MKVEELVDSLMKNPATPDDIDVVTKQLGRYPRGIVAVGARCICGNPLAVVTRPLLEGGVPFPTTCYLTSPEAVKAVSHVEAEGEMRAYNDLLATDDDLAQRYRAAHQSYLSFRHVLAQRLHDDESHIEGISAGGMPVRVKCLHALLAQSLVMGTGINPIGDQVLVQIKGEFSPQVCRCELYNNRSAN
jgi:hypothetical protein